MNITLDFRNDACVVELIDGDEVNLILPLSIPPISHLRKSLRLHDFVLEIAFQGSTRKTFIVIGDVAAKEREQIALYQRLVRIDEAEPKSQEVDCCSFSCKMASSLTLS